MKDELKLTPEQKAKVIANAETKIIDMLLSAQNSKISDGYYGWHVRSYKSFIWQFAFLSPIEKDFVDEACESLIKKEFIDVCDGPEREDIYIKLKKQYYVSLI